MTESKTYDELEQKYSRFETPDCEVLVGGNNVIENLGLGLERVFLELSAEGQSSICEITVLGAYDIQKRTFHPDLLEAFAPGTAVEVNPGYIKKETVFKGFVWSQKLQHPGEGAAKFIVTCMDARRLMMENHIHKHFLDKSVADIIGEVLDAYGQALKGGQQISAPTGKLEMVTQNGSDFVFLEEMAERTGRTFTVFNGKAYITDAWSAKSPCVTLEMGENILHLEIERIYRNISVNVYSPTGLTTADGANEAASRDWQQSIGPAAMISVPWPGLEAEACKTLAQSLYDRRMRGAADGLVRTRGLPELVPGRFVKLTKVGGGYDGVYYIRAVRHVIDENGYVTELDLGGSG